LEFIYIGFPIVKFPDIKLKQNKNAPCDTIWIHPSIISFWVHKICDQAGLPHRTVHSLRHTNITMQIAAGVPLVTVAGRAGHARTSTTTDIYSHFLKSSDRTAAEKIEELFD
jgi:integrase